MLKATIAHSSGKSVLLVDVPDMYMVTGLLALASTRGAAATSARDDEAADNLGKSLASLFLLKEENVPAAKQSMNVFQVQCQ